MRYRLRPATALGALLLLVVSSGLPAAQVPAAQDQPGLKWTDEQIRKTAHHVRAGHFSPG